MQREIRLTPILLLVLGIATVLVVGIILLVWAFLPPNLQSGLPFAISTVVIVNTALLRVIPVLGRRLIGDDSAALSAFTHAPAPSPAPARFAHPPQHAVAPSVPVAPTTSRTCRRCGHVAQAGDAFCRKCGQSLTAPLVAPPAAPIAQPLAQPMAQPAAQPMRAPAYSAPKAAAWANAGPITSVGGTVAVTPPVHRFMSKRALRYFLFIGTALNVLAFLLYVLCSFILASCSPDADIAACSSTTTGILSVLIVLTLAVWVPGIVLVLLADVFALIRTALVRRWGWFIAILVTYIVLWNAAMFFYVFIGPDDPPASQLPAAGYPPR